MFLLFEPFSCGRHWHLTPQPNFNISPCLLSSSLASTSATRQCAACRRRGDDLVVQLLWWWCGGGYPVAAVVYCWCSVACQSGWREAGPTRPCQPSLFPLVPLSRRAPRAGWVGAGRPGGRLLGSAASRASTTHNTDPPTDGTRAAPGPQWCGRLATRRRRRRLLLAEQRRDRADRRESPSLSLRHDATHQDAVGDICCGNLIAPAPSKDTSPSRGEAASLGASPAAGPA